MTCDRALFRVRSEMTGQRATAVISIALATWVAAAAVASTGEVPEWEADALRFVNDWPDWLEPPMWAFQQVGVLGAPLVAGVLIARIARRWQYAVPFVLLIPIKLGIEWLLLKRTIERGRPYQTVGPEIRVRGPAFDGLSFPSGHSTTAVAFALLLVALLPRRWHPVVLAWAFVVGVARLYYGEHNVLDVVAGFALGAIYGTVLWFTILNRYADGGSSS